jgi:hypothetical protein
VTLFNLPVAVACGLLLWRSLDWPLVGDAAIFHFIAGQMRMGAVSYRDIVDINMPLIYFVHAAVVAVGGMGDVAWRAFDLTSAALMSGLILALVWPAGRALATHAALIVLATHLLLGPYAAGQRDYLMSIPALAVALLSARAAENPERRWLELLLAGACAVIAAAIKPSGLLLLALPAITMAGLRRREAAWIMAGAAGTGLVLLGVLAASGALAPFVAMLQGLMPLYAALDSRKISDIVKDTAGWLAPTDGLALAAALAIAVPKPPRARALIGLTLFGLVHLLAQGKGWFYHGYPPCRAFDPSRGSVPDDHGCNARVAGATRAHASDDLPGAARRLGHAAGIAKPPAARRESPGARFGQRRLHRHGARRDAAGHIAYPMVLSSACAGFGPTRFRDRARRRSAGSDPADEFAMAASERLRGCRPLARIRRAVDLALRPGPNGRRKRHRVAALSSTRRPFRRHHWQRCAALVRMLFSAPDIRPAPPFHRKLIGQSRAADHPSDAD